MANDTVSFPAETRAAEKKSDVTELRNTGFIPAIVYSKGESGTPVKLNEHDFEMMLKQHSGENMMIDLVVDGGKARHVLLKEIQHHPLSNRILHVDFHEISLDRLVKVHVVVDFQGTPVGVAQGGGTLDIQTREVEVECKASAIVDNLPVDVSELEIGSSISAADLTLPAGYTLLTAENVSLANVLAPRVSAASGTSEEEGSEEEAAETEEDA